MLQALYNCYKKHGELIAFIDLNKSHNNTITWEELFQNIRCVSAYLNSLNLKKGFRAVIAIENSIEWIEIFFGVILSGGIAVPIDPKDSFENIEKKIHSIYGSVVFLNEEIVGKTKNLDNDIPGNIIILEMVHIPKNILDMNKSLDTIGIICSIETYHQMMKFVYFFLLAQLVSINLLCLL